MTDIKHAPAVPGQTLALMQTMMQKTCNAEILYATMLLMFMIQQKLQLKHQQLAKTAQTTTVMEKQIALIVTALELQDAALQFQENASFFKNINLGIYSEGATAKATKQNVKG